MKEKDVERLLDKFDESSLNDFEFSNKDFKLSLSKRSDSAPVVVNDSKALQSTPMQHAAAVATATKPQKKVAASENDANLAQVKAPLVGIVYMSPKPDKPAFKSVGDHVSKGEVVCLIEAMKMVNEVKSKVSGTIKEVLVKDGDMVQYDQPIFKITKE